jgi:hypothetical protein
MASYGSPQPWDGGPPSATAMMRASDADRERTVDVLKAAFAEGRLTSQEYDERSGRAYRARTYGELGGLVADLPQGPVPMPPAAGPIPMTFRPASPGPGNGQALASLICGVAGLFVGVTAVPAILLGHRARREIRATGESGGAMATVGIVLGWLVAGCWAAVLALAVVVVVIAGATGH